jgi:hypothetical protein
MVNKQEQKKLLTEIMEADAQDVLYKQQTAVEWLHHLYKEGILIQKSFEMAKEMEKEQMHKCASFWRGKENEIEKPMFDLYYNETYNK